MVSVSDTRPLHSPASPKFSVLSSSIMYFAQQSYEYLGRPSIELDDISSISRSQSRSSRQIRQSSAEHLDTTPLNSAGGQDEHRDGTNKAKQRRCSKFTGWRFGMKAYAWTALFICLTNVIVAIVLARTTTIVEGVGTPYTGPCDKVDKIGLLVHLAINILSSLLLEASNYSMQCLAAPTRSECSRAHSRYDWLDVGVNSMRNLRKIGWRRTLLWTILGMSSLPIHLLYNSVFFEVVSTNEYNVVYVSPNFLNDGAKTPVRVDFNSSVPHPTQDSICSMNGRNLTHDSVENDLRHVLSSCHMSDCGVPTSATGSPYNTSMLGEQVLEQCFNKSSCAVLGTNGSTSPLDLTAIERARYLDWPLWNVCHFSNCTFLKGGDALDSPSMSGLLDECYLNASSTIKIEVTHLWSITASQWDKYAKNSTNWQNMTLTQCLTEYRKDVVSKWNDVFVVLSGYDDPKLYEGQGVYNSFSSSYSADIAAESPDRHQYSWLEALLTESVNPNEDSRIILDNLSTYNGSIEYCMAEKHDDICGLQFSPTLLAVVIVCNALKVVSMFVAVFWTREQPLVVMGDAIHSFLMRPDDTTRGHCFTTVKTLTTRRQGRQKSEPAPEASTTARLRSKRLFKSINTAQLCYSLGFISLFLAAALALLVISVQSAKFYIKGSSIWTFSQGVNLALTLPRSYDSPQGSSALISAVLLANTPQLVLSIAYLLYNNMLTVMLRHQEWMSFSAPAAPQSLRVTNPRGQQRTSYSLHVPFKYGIPLLIASTLLHWMVSSSFFMVRINGYAQGIADPKAFVTTLGYSPLWILLSILLGLVVLSGMMVIGFQRFKTAMPMNSSNSFIIAASCHTSKADSKAALGLIHWGALMESKDEVGHCTFTSLPVQDPGSLGRYD